MLLTTMCFHQRLILINGFRNFFEESCQHINKADICASNVRRKIHFANSSNLQMLNHFAKFLIFPATCCSFSHRYSHSMQKLIKNVFVDKRALQIWSTGHTKKILFHCTENKKQKRSAHELKTQIFEIIFLIHTSEQRYF